MQHKLLSLSSRYCCRININLNGVFAGWSGVDNTLSPYQLECGKEFYWMEWNEICCFILFFAIWSLSQKTNKTRTEKEGNCASSSSASWRCLSNEVMFNVKKACQKVFLFFLHHPKTWMNSQEVSSCLMSLKVVVVCSRIYRWKAREIEVHLQWKLRKPSTMWINQRTFDGRVLFNENCSLTRTKEQNFCEIMRRKN